MAVEAKIIDVSEHHGVINWEKVKPHIDGAIIRCGYGMDTEKQDDTFFKHNADECTRLGIPFGVYIYSYADNVDRIKSEAAHALRLVQGYQLSYPIYLDLEEFSTRNGAAERAHIFGDIIENAGYMCGIYANLNWWNNYLRGLDRFTKWVAQYYKECQYRGSNLDMWQYTDSGSVPGIDGKVDMNHCYRDFPGEISAGKNVPAAGESGDQTVKPDILSYGSSGPQVKALQILLIGNGCTCGEWGADGNFGIATENAVKEYQRKNHLHADGVAGPETWRSLLGIA